MDRKPCDLLSHWNKNAKGQLTQSCYSVRLPLEDAAKLEALRQMYPKLTLEQLIGDIISSALHEIEEAMPYIPGTKVAAVDEFGDAIYADIGPTPTFQQLAQAKLQELKH